MVPGTRRLYAVALPNSGIEKALVRLRRNPEALIGKWGEAVTGRVI